MTELTHFDKSGRPQMVDVTEKAVTERAASAEGFVSLSEMAYQAVKDRSTKKGDPIAVAELAGIMAVKRTADIIPLCHPLPIGGVHLRTELIADTANVRFVATVKTSGRTGVEMEALTAVSAACLTLYDMVKAIDKSMVISGIALLEKSGGQSGDYQRKPRDT
ncbi:MAG: cyclic pyranopterin monophosphate synthase MoaC [Pseudomonadota bacterium]